MLNIKTGTIRISDLAAALGKNEEEKTLPNGRVVTQVTWKGEDLKGIAELLHNQSAQMPEVVQVDGSAPAWLVTAITHECHPRSVALNSPDGYVGIGCQKSHGEGEGIDFTVRHREDGWTVVKFELNPSVPLSPEQLDGIAPPELPMGAKVILSGRGPNWLTASLAMSYHGRTQAVACYQLGTGSTVSITHTAKVELGSVIPGDA